MCTHIHFNFDFIGHWPKYHLSDEYVAINSKWKNNAKGNKVTMAGMLIRIKQKTEYK